MKITGKYMYIYISDFQVYFSYTRKTQNVLSSILLYLLLNQQKAFNELFFTEKNMLSHCHELHIVSLLAHQMFVPCFYELQNKSRLQPQQKAREKNLLRHLKEVTSEEKY